MIKSFSYLIIVLLTISLSAVSFANADDPTKPIFFKKKNTTVKKSVVKKKIVKRPTVSEKYLLTSTLISKNRTVAVVNNRVVSVGDKVGRATVLSINSSQVVLRSGNRKINLQLTANKLKKGVAVR